MTAQIETVSKSPVTRAWASLRTGRNEDAVVVFDELLKADSEDVDAYYGKGMALRAANKDQDAIQAFQAALNISQTLLNTVREKYGIGEGMSSLDTVEDDRYMMLSRMIRQRLSELGIEDK